MCKVLLQASDPGWLACFLVLLPADMVDVAFHRGLAGNLKSSLANFKEKAPMPLPACSPYHFLADWEEHP